MRGAAGAGSRPHCAETKRARQPPSMLGHVTDIGDGPFRRGEPVWVVQADGSQRAAEYVGVGETSAWFGGPPQVIIVYPDTPSGEAVEVDRVIPRDG